MALVAITALEVWRIVQSRGAGAAARLHCDHWPVLVVAAVPRLVAVVASVTLDRVLTSCFSRRPIDDPEFADRRDAYVREHAQFLRATASPTNRGGARTRPSSIRTASSSPVPDRSPYPRLPAS